MLPGRPAVMSNKAVEAYKRWVRFARVENWACPGTRAIARELASFVDVYAPAGHSQEVGDVLPCRFTAFEKQDVHDFTISAARIPM